MDGTVPPESTGDPPAQPAPDERHRTQEELVDVVGSKEERKIRARQEGQRGIWFGLGMFGIVGWSVAVPMLALVALGIWIDTRWPSRYSWTLMLLVLGVILGCLNAWYWVNRERTKIVR